MEKYQKTEPKGQERWQNREEEAPRKGLAVDGIGSHCRGCLSKDNAEMVRSHPGQDDIELSVGEDQDP